MAGGVELTINGGALGSEGALVERKGPLAFSIRLASSRGLPACPNMLQFQLLDAARETVEIDARFEHEAPRAMFDEYHHAATPDFAAFRLLEWESPPNGRANRLRIPPTGWDSFSVGMQYPLPNESLAEHVARWAVHPDADVSVLGYSELGRPIWHVAVKGNRNAPRWRHCVANFHPGEGNARWRIVGMVDWLLSDEGAAARRECAVDFFPLLAPDGPANGWRRVDATGVDMNRCFREEGADLSLQPREAFLFQSFLETARERAEPHNTLWCMHTWPGPVEPLFDGLGPEFDGADRSFEAFQSVLKRFDPDGHIKSPAVRLAPGLPTTWNGGVAKRYGITSVLVEGGGAPCRLAEHIEGGQSLMAAICASWSDILPSPKHYAVSGAVETKDVE